MDAMHGEETRSSPMSSGASPQKEGGDCGEKKEQDRPPLDFYEHDIIGEDNSSPGGQALEPEHGP